MTLQELQHEGSRKYFSHENSLVTKEYTESRFKGVSERHFSYSYKKKNYYVLKHRHFFKRALNHISLYQPKKIGVQMKSIVLLPKIGTTHKMQVNTSDNPYRLLWIICIALAILLFFLPAILGSTSFDFFALTVLLLVLALIAFAIFFILWLVHLKDPKETE